MAIYVNKIIGAINPRSYQVSELVEKQKRILLVTFGTLGDVYPFLAIAHAMRRKGLTAVVAAPEMHRDSIEREGVAYVPLRPHENDIVSALGVDVPGAFEIMLKNPYFILDEIYLRFLRETYNDTLAAAEGVDAIVTHSLLVGANLAAEKLGLPCARIALAPMYVQSAATPSVTPPAPYVLQPRSRLAVAYNEIVRHGIRASVNLRMSRLHAFRREAGLPQSREDLFLDFGRKNRASKIFGLYSPRFAAHPSDGPCNMVVPGFPFYGAQDQRRYELEKSLEAFLSSGSPPVVFTLGSFAPQVSGDFYDISINAVRTLGRRAVVLAGPKDVARLSSCANANEFDCQAAPHSLLFPHASCVVHHGGIGTTAQALRSGKPQLVVPFFGDQPDHGSRIERLGLGITVKLSKYDLRNSILALAELHKMSYRRAAADFAVSMQSEQGVAEVADWAARIMLA